MFKAPFSFDGRIRRIEYFLSGIIGGIVFGVAYSLGLATLFLGVYVWVYVVDVVYVYKIGRAHV